MKGRQFNFKNYSFNYNAGLCTGRLALICLRDAEHGRRAVSVIFEKLPYIAVSLHFSPF